ADAHAPASWRRQCLLDGAEFSLPTHEGGPARGTVSGHGPTLPCHRERNAPYCDRPRRWRYGRNAMVDRKTALEHRPRCQRPRLRRRQRDLFTEIGQLGTNEGRTNASTRRQQRSEEHTSELQSRENLVCRLLLEKTNQKIVAVT